MVVAHGDLAAGLVSVVAAITGDHDTLVGVSNRECGGDGLLDRLRTAVGDGRAVLFVDLPGGSCFTAGARFRHERGDTPVVGGVSLPMLVDFVMHPELAVDVRIEHAVNAGRRAMKVMGT